MVEPQFSRLAIADRGESAMRVLYAMRELNHQRPDPVVLIALHTEAERDAMFVRYADEAVCGGPGPIALERALPAARADAAWVGGGPVAPAGVADLCQRLGVVCVGPHAAAWRIPDAGPVTPPAAPVATPAGVQAARHGCVSIVAGGHGVVWPLGASDRSYQRRGRTLLAESSSPALAPGQEREIMDAARRLALDDGYRGAGTV